MYSCNHRNIAALCNMVAQFAKRRETPNCSQLPHFLTCCKLMPSPQYNLFHFYSTITITDTQALPPTRTSTKKNHMWAINLQHQAKTADCRPCSTSTPQQADLQATNDHHSQHKPSHQHKQQTHANKIQKTITYLTQTHTKQTHRFKTQLAKT